MDQWPASSADGRLVQSCYSTQLTCFQWRGPGKIYLFSIERWKLKVMHLVSRNIYIVRNICNLPDKTCIYNDAVDGLLQFGLRKSFGIPVGFSLTSCILNCHGPSAGSYYPFALYSFCVNI
jgi:hypothetical protein